MGVKNNENNHFKFNVLGGELVFSKEIIVFLLAQAGILGVCTMYFGLLNAVMTLIALGVVCFIFLSFGFLRIRVERIEDDSLVENEEIINNNQF